LPFVAPLALLVALAAACRPAINKLAAAATLVALGLLALLQGWLSDGSTRWTNCRATATPTRAMLADSRLEVDRGAAGLDLRRSTLFRAKPDDAHGVEGARR